ncbi:GNAT family N-acetyltransferase [Streptosporangium amethystogenes]|uniref:GNAT family N-acetyltransferase n=1 Tax=Streptosporangium amethystogenes TaxID=2002 RepID=UPI0037B8FCA9
MEPVILTTQRLLLRPLEPSDAEALFLACQDPDIQRWTGIPAPYERQHAEYFLRQLVPEGRQKQTMFHFAVEPRSGGPLLASVNVHNHTGTWEIGYWTAQEHRGHGYATEGLLAIARWAFTTLGVHRLEWRAEAGNEGSRTVAEKAGFVFEGVLRAAMMNHGTWRDVWIGALLPSDLEPSSAS